MLGAGNSGAMHRRGRISVCPGGQDSPSWIGLPRPPPRWAMADPDMTKVAARARRTVGGRMRVSLAEETAINSRVGRVPMAGDGGDRDQVGSLRRSGRA